MKMKNLLMAAVAGLATSCTTQQSSQPFLPSWNDTPVKEQLKNYLHTEVEKIPVEDRVAVFDMDGTLACEKPVWFGMGVAAHRMAEMAKADPSLLEQKEYQMAQKLDINHGDTTIVDKWYEDGIDYGDSILLKAFAGMENEEFVSYTNKYLNTYKDAKHNMIYADMFYQPMIELIGELQQKQFQIYIVSGSIQGVVWSICPQVLGFERDHLIGTRQAMQVSFPQNGPVSYVLKKEYLKPSNNYYNKSINIYNHIGKNPVVAIGNTVGDFGMFHMASCSQYPNLSLMLNHDDDAREYAYPPYYSGHPNWQDSLRLNKWIQADMSKEFKTVWKIK